MRADLRLALELADTAAAMALERFRAEDLRVEYKADGSPVTEADRDIERVLRQRIEAERPGHAITGEEFGESGDSDWRWYLDPIDGTTSYVAGEEDWEIFITLTRRDVPEVAVVDSPHSGTRWWAARGEGAFKDGEAIRVSTRASLGQAIVGDDWRRTLASGVADHPLAELAARCRSFRPYTGQTFLRLAGGEADVAVGIGGLAWDYAPMMLIVQEAGGRFTDLDGRLRFDTGTALVTNGALHDEALAVLRDGGG